MNRIIGIDVGRGSAILCCLDKFPDNILQHYKKLKNNQQFYKVNCSRDGVEKLLALKPTGIVIEPTGYWYSQFWVTVAQKNNIAVYCVGHNNLDKFRGSYYFPNKRDEEDALSLAAMYFDDRFIDIQGNKPFLKLTHNAVITRVRDLFNEKEQLQKIRTNLVSQLRQRLSYEFPEVAKHYMKISEVRGYTPIIYWLATGKKNVRYDNKYKQSMVHDLEIKIADYTRSHAFIIFGIEERIIQHQKLIAALINEPQFAAYHRVFDKFKFGDCVRALLLFNLYPFEKYLVNGKPWVEYEYSKDKLQKRDRSLRKFQGFVGLSFTYKQSGNKTKRQFHGNGTIRSHLYMWAICTITQKRNVHHTEITQELSDRYQELTKSVKGKDAITRLLFKLTRMLFYELVKEISIKSL